MPPARRVKALHRSIVRWYGTHARDFIWRRKRSPYVILVSEFMLQQTQTSRVTLKLTEFLSTFPTLRALAQASTADVIRAWSGLGYNIRALRLHSTARLLVSISNGRIPHSVDDLRRLPGIGPYASHAIACFAFRQRVPVVDVNVRRVLSRIFHRSKAPDSIQTERTIRKLATDLLPTDAYTWNQALMDLGATICTAAAPTCAACPVRKFCASRDLGSIAQRRQPQTMQRHLKKEPMYAGVPRRLWRGMIIEALRQMDGRRSTTILSLGKTVKKDFRRNELPWLTSLLHTLTDDGLVTFVSAHRVRLVHE